MYGEIDEVIKGKENLSQEDLAHIERYWAKELSKKELQDFQIRYKTDPAFAGQVDLFRKAKDAVEVLGQKRLKESFRKQYQSESSQVKKLPTKWMFAAAAVIAFLIAFALWPKSESSSFSPNELYTQYYSFEALSLERGANETDSLFRLANEAYNAQAFEQAIPLLENLRIAPNFNRGEYVLLHLGISYIEIGDLEKAHLTLSEISQESSFYQKANWYLSLSYLKLNRVKDAQFVLENLGNDSRVYGKQAREILERL